ncbi:AsmA family protein [Maricaulis sp.]|uniref:AsmA family protein n=1 Tax=Maricaulis sp. TaxID=1486257 RepID=UPI00261832EB|nr:AsmA family protein [Maricaulis sp.]
MTRLLRFLLILILILAGLAVAAPMLIPAETFRDRIASETSSALGREVVLAGDMRLSILPRVEISAGDVSIANADGFGDQPMAEMSQLRVGVKLIPLFSRSVEVEEFVLVDPVIRLASNRRGNNWTFRSGDGSEAQPAAGPGFERRPGALPFEASFGDVRVENATILYSGNGQNRQISGLNARLTLPSLDDAAGLTGALSADGEQLTFNAELGSVRGLFEGAETPLSLQVGGNLMRASFDGVIREGSDIVLAGAIDSAIPSLRDLAAFAGSALPPGEQLQRFAASGDLVASAERIDLDSAEVRLDDISGSGTLDIALTGPRPRITGALTVPALNITPYLPEQSTGGSGGESGNGGGLPPWSETPIDLTGLGVIDADLDLAVGLFEYGEIDVSDVDLDVVIENSRLDARLRRFGLYEGTGAVRVVANNRNRRPSFRVVANLDGLDALPFLDAAAGFDRLSGRGGMDLDLRASGDSQAAIMRSLAGSGQFGFRDGAITGINLAETIRNVNSFFNAAPAGEAETSSEDESQAETGDQAQTDFSSLNGSFTITGGRATTEDLAMLSPLLRVAGNGWLNMGEQALDLRMRPRLVASIEGQGGAADLRGLEIPVRIRGSFNDVSVGVDTDAVGRALLGSALSNALGGDGEAQSPEDALRQGLLDALGLGNRDDEPAGDEEPSEQREVDPAEQLLRGLFGNRSSDDDNGDGPD